jgi:predicted nucleotidyltransferase
LGRKRRYNKLLAIGKNAKIFEEMTSKEIIKRKKALQEFKKELIRSFDKEILEMKIFGSMARKESRKDSDIDVLIVFKSLSKKRKDFVLKLATKILLKYGVDISPHLYSEKEYLKENRLSSVFMQILKREALPL